MLQHVPCPGCPALLWPPCSVLAALHCLPCPGCPAMAALAALPWLPCPALLWPPCSALAALPWLPCPDCPALTALLWLPCPGCPGLAALHCLPWLCVPMVIADVPALMLPEPLTLQQNHVMCIDEPSLHLAELLPSSRTPASACLQVHSTAKHNSTTA